MNKPTAIQTYQEQLLRDGKMLQVSAKEHLNATYQRLERTRQLLELSTSAIRVA